MANTLVRVSGVVIDVPTPRRGVKTADDGTRTPWEIATLNVLVANRNVTVVQLPRRDDSGKLPFVGTPDDFRVGDTFDALVEVELYRNTPQFRAIGDFPLSNDVPSYLTGQLADA